MTNNLKTLRESRGLTQAELVSLLRPACPEIDAPMLSRFEHGLCLPTPRALSALARALWCAESDLYSPEPQSYLDEIISGTAPAEPESMAVSELISVLGEGREKAKTRRQLCLALDMPDRAVRKLITEAREAGYIIINNQDGNGYYLASDTADMLRFVRQEDARARSIFRATAPARTALKREGIRI